LRKAVEALNNALKHAEASKVNVSLRIVRHRDLPCVELEILDDGKGFTPDSHEDEGGLGLMGMQERIEELGGELTIQSTPGEGTVLKACVDMVAHPTSEGPLEALS
jgi:signal transduction histidine kinase